MKMILAAALAATWASAYAGAIADVGAPAQDGVAARVPAASAIDATVAARRAADAAALNEAGALIQSRQPQAAIERVLDRLIADRESDVRDVQSTVYCANTLAESLMYAASAASAASAANTGKGALVVDGTLCNAYFMRGYAEVDLGKLKAANADYERALSPSPRNPHYLNEVGQFHSRMRDWTGALALFQRAEADSKGFAVEGRANAELGLALRGIGYVDVELGKLDDAEAAYRRCIEIDANDRKAKAELSYVLGLKAKQVGLAK
jgi:tetratricopeptide (TPR) repeat protein